MYVVIMITIYLFTTECLLYVFFSYKVQFREIHKQMRPGGLIPLLSGAVEETKDPRAREALGSQVVSSGKDAGWAESSNMPLGSNFEKKM